MTFLQIWQNFCHPKKSAKMKFKNIFKNTSNMAAENTDIDQKVEDVTMENNATGEQVVVE